MLNIQEILARSIELEASDVHINVGMVPMARKNTDLLELDYNEVTNEDARQMLISMVGSEKFKQFEEKKDLDFSTMINEGYRFRVNAHYQRGTIALSFRVISNVIPSIDDLHLPEIVKELTELPRGVVLVTGHTGSGKSTSLASMINVINSKCRKRIITLEDPVEYALSNEKCMIEQREIGSDCTNFASGLRHALRQDPDIIMVGEMRDLETTSSTITAAETGHLVFSTLHTINAPQTIERIIDVYPAAQQNQIRAMLANTLQAVISQTLFPRIDQPGMVPCCEILLCTSAVRNCVRENRIYEIPNIIETSRRIGMQSMDHSIEDMFLKGFLSRDEAVMRSSNPGKMDKKLPAHAEAAAVSAG
ncbi:MAG: PilT/PilU family type 4a pilus ATPase [Planctomycetes bacterium]|nr:PilT/PilU family type 4a pilus ATPase [Planctomycetota bacterium]MBL7106590.1 PilT/PilU family type 4a pilus ATPase [Phycisphaerae bacterium]